jgi:lipoteichoic acid synthase
MILSAIYGGVLYLLFNHNVSDEVYATQFKLFASLILLGVFWVIPIKLSVFISNILVAVLSFYLFVQTVYFRAFSQYVRLNTAFSLINELIDNLDNAFDFVLVDDFVFLWPPALFLIASIAVFILKSRFRVKRWFIEVALGLIVIASGVQFLFFVQSGLDQDMYEIDIWFYYKTNHYVYTTVPTTNLFVDKFGLMGLLYRDVEQFVIVPNAQDFAASAQEIQSVFDQHPSYLSSEYHGIFEGKSLLMIEVESLVYAVIDPVLTPTLYRLIQNGMVIEGFNAPLLPGSTSDTEFMAITSLLPANDGFNTFHRYYANEYPQTLATLFSAQGYSSTAFHNNYGEFYNRTEMLPSLGFEFFDFYDLGLPGNEALDSETLERMKWIFFEQEQFLSYWITFNGHQPYDEASLDPQLFDYLRRVQERFPMLPEGESVYLAKTMDFDVALERLILDYENNNKSDQLVIILFGDHFPKGLLSDDSTKTMLCDEDELFKCNRTPLIIWHQDEFVGKLSKPSSPLDILPAVVDLFGLNIISDFIIGSSVLNEDFEGFAFDMYGRIETQGFVYNQIEDDLKLKNASSVEEVEDAIFHYKRVLDVLPKIVEIDFFKRQQDIVSN